MIYKSHLPNRYFSFESSIDENKYSQVAYDREKAIKFYDSLPRRSCQAKCEFLKIMKISRATIFRWKKRYKQEGLRGLENESRCPNKTRVPAWTKEHVSLIIKLRKNYQIWGKEKIQIILKRDYGINLSVSTVGRVLSKHFALGTISKAQFFYGRLTDKNRRVFNKHARRWKYGMKAGKPGFLVQIDHAVIELPSGKRIKHFNATCPVTKIRSDQAYSRATSKNAADFLDQILREFPFKIRSIQVDGGSEFMGAFEQAAKRRNVDLFVLPPKSPKYNGNVERSNSTVKYEFYRFYRGSERLQAVRNKLKIYNHSYNKFRPHQRLQNLTPMQYYRQRGPNM